MTAFEVEMLLGLGLIVLGVVVFVVGLAVLARDDEGERR